MQDFDNSGGVMSFSHLARWPVVASLSIFLATSPVAQIHEPKQDSRNSWHHEIPEKLQPALGIGALMPPPRGQGYEQTFVLVAQLDPNDGFSEERAWLALKIADIQFTADENLQIAFVCVPPDRAREAKLLLTVSSLIYGYRLDHGK